MKESNALQAILQEHISWNKARLCFLAHFIVALIKVRTANLTQVALTLNPLVLPASNYRRIQRFLAGFRFDINQIGRILLALLPTDKDFIVTIDRTNWQFGIVPINVLMIGIAWQGLAFPILWQLLPKKGSSCTEERIALMRRFLRIVGSERIRVVVADREFIGHQWLDFLAAQHLPFAIRIRSNALIGSQARAKAARMYFASLSVGCSQPLRGKRWIYGHRLFIVGMRLSKCSGDDFLILITDIAKPRDALTLYAQRWQIETLFGAMKSRGFNFEDTHLRDPERIERLIALLALAFAWAYLVGDWLGRVNKPIKIKSHGRRAQSVFRYGLDHLRMVLLNIDVKTEEYFTYIKILSCT
jgi:hypothetical protein